MSDTDLQLPTPELRQEIWSRASVFDETPKEISTFLAKRGSPVPVEQIRAVLEAEVEVMAEDLIGRRGRRVKTAASIAARRRLILGEVRRIQVAMKERGGLEESTRVFDSHGALKTTKLRVRDGGFALLAAERALAELDRFSAALDGLLHEEVLREKPSIEVRYPDNWPGWFTDPDEGRRLFGGASE